MADAITIKALQDASLDAKSLEEVVNGNESKQVTTRKGETYPSVKKAIKTMFENGGLPAAPFKTKVLMTASALANGKYAMVTDDTVNNGLYVKTAGAWVKSDYDPLTQAKADATAKADAAKTQAVEISDSHVSYIKEAIGQYLPAGYKWGVLDGYGRMAIGVDDSGYLDAIEISTDNINVKNINGKLYGYNKVKQNPPNLSTDISVLLSYGQSLSIGAVSGGAVSTTQKYNSVMLSQGIIYADYATPVDLSTSLLVPAVEKTNETVLSGASEFIHDLLEHEDGYDYTRHDFKFGLSATGQGSQSVNSLKKGTPLYTRNINTLQRFKELASGDNKVAKCLAWFWSQGEQDDIGKMPKDTYKLALNTLIGNFEEDIKTITGQVDDVVCIGYQLQIPFSNVESYPIPTIGLAQQELSTQNNKYFISCPLYHLKQSLHPVAWAYIVIGAYYGLVYKRVVIDQKSWQPLEPTNIEVFGKVMLVKFNVPEGGLVLDSESMPEFNNYGFSCVDQSGVNNDITEVSLTSADTVRIVTTNTLGAGSKLRYGYDAGGNLRDEQGDFLQVNANGTIFPLHNWCLIFEKVVF